MSATSATRGFMGELMDRTRPDALVHLAAIPRPSLGTPLEVFAMNTEATSSRSSPRAMPGCAGSSSPRVPPSSARSSPPRHPSRRSYAPVDEDHPFIGSDPYALSKQVDEATAATMHRRHGYQVVALRIPNTGPMEVQAARATAVAADPSVLANELWAYLDIRDAARAFAVALEREVPGCHVVTVMAPDTISPEPTADLLARFHPTTRLRRPIEGREVPFDLTRARDLLGFEVEHLVFRTERPDSADRTE